MAHNETPMKGNIMNLHDPLELARAQYMLELTNPTSFKNLYRLAKLKRKINRIQNSK